MQCMLSMMMDSSFPLNFQPSTAAVLRLLRLNQPSKPGRHHHPNRLMIEEEEGFHGSSIAFASSPSDSEEEEEEGVVDTTPARPTLRLGNFNLINQEIIVKIYYTALSLGQIVAAWSVCQRQLK